MDEIKYAIYPGTVTLQDGVTQKVWSAAALAAAYGVGKIRESYDWSGTPHLSTSLYANTRNPNAARINLVANPGLEVDLLGHNNSGTVTRTRDTTRKLFGSASMKMVNAGASGSDFYSVLATYGAPLKTNTNYIFSAYCYLESYTAPANSNRALLATNGAINPVAVSTLDPTKLGQWVRHSLVINTGAGTTLNLRLYSPIGTIYWDGILLEEGTVLRDYFDGSFPDVLDYIVVNTPLEEPQGMDYFKYLHLKPRADDLYQNIAYTAEDDGLDVSYRPDFDATKKYIQETDPLNIYPDERDEEKLEDSY